MCEDQDAAVGSPPLLTQTPHAGKQRLQEKTLPLSNARAHSERRGSKVKGLEVKLAAVETPGLDEVMQTVARHPAVVQTHTHARARAYTHT